MAHTYTPSDDAILTVQDAAERIRQLEARVANLEQGAHTTSREWISHGQDEWSLFDEGISETVATIYRSPGREMFTAHVYYPGGGTDMDHLESEHGAKTWCENQLRHAARLSERAAELERTGAVDDTEGSEEFDHKQYLAELADAKDDHDLSSPL